MTAWRVDIDGLDLAPKVPLQFMPEGVEAPALQSGDPLYYVNSKNERAKGSAIHREKSEAVIEKEGGRWRIQETDRPNQWTVVGAVE
jgi:hypothetical protein